MAIYENWQAFVHDTRYNHAMGVYTHCHAQAAKLTEEQLIQTEQFRKSHVSTRNILRFFRERNVGCAVSAQKIFNAVAKIKKNRMQGRNKVEEVLCLSAKRDYTVFYRNREDSNVLSDIVVAHPTSIKMMRTWSYVNMPLLEVVGMTPTENQEDVCDHDQEDVTDRECGLMPLIGDVFNTAYHMLHRRHINQNVLAKLTELTKDEEIASQFVNGSWKKLLDEIDKQEYLRKLDALKTKWKNRPEFLHYLFNNWFNPFAHKLVRYWTKIHMHFWVETTNRAESEHSVLKLWLSTCHGDLATAFLNIDSFIKGQIADIKASLEFSKTKEKFNTKSNQIFFIICSEIPRAARIYNDPKNKCGHYLRTSDGLPCAFDLITQFDHVLPIQLSDIEAFWKTVEIGSRHPSARQQDMDSKMHSLTDLLHQISTGPISKVREMRRLAKGVLSLVLPEDPVVTLTSPPEIAVTKGRKKTNSTKRDESHWEHLSISHRKIQKSSGSGSDSSSGSGSWSGSGSGSGSCVRGKPPRAPREGAEGAIVAKNVIGDGNCGYRVVADFMFGDEHQWPKVRRRMFYKLEHSANVYLNLVGSAERVSGLVHRIRWQDGPAPYEH
ncbi:hypothetical protein M9H77_26703 [Catharanthus roseus]|uniref:Uncharacterized protein n=1 Tax=Catharanthus roseus TaxID=4058 RepID=A0ACC0AAP1_CATRO|nr:hypothetical protein M9H77_26703 [Catharanthus roseus]